MGAGSDVSDASMGDQPARQKWNRRYREKDWRPFPDAPSQWLLENRSFVTGAPGRRALDVACGDGRNALYLARCGFAVDAVDVSDVAIDALRAEALARDLTISPRQVDLEAHALPVERYDVIVQINYLQRDLCGPLAEALTPGGILIVETVTRAHIEELGQSFDRRFVLERNELLRSFPDLDVRHYWEGVVDRSGRPRGVASLVAQRRGDEATARPHERHEP
jgi:tellurite methyltransferase